MYYVYVLLSSKDHRRYIGSTDNLTRRLHQHDTGQVRSTRSRRPLQLIYSEEYLDGTEARKREHFLKTHKGFNELKRVLAQRGIV